MTCFTPESFLDPARDATTELIADPTLDPSPDPVPILWLMPIMDPPVLT